MEQDVLAERERCAQIAEALAKRWEATAARYRADHTVRPLLFGKPYVTPLGERDAKAIDAAVHGVRAIVRLIRGGISL